ncbi:hypothetical protein B0T14DRAFT_518003 [Immersiella caudata]|uniref:Uncharacterized protein n=1 Tax=Immersiella caudata TaxID=314043 RepID=A0AA39WZB6_9PEZI|nr:hypothetical protein B0T14DRAFT_518003 [Immersiella caudata]
MVSSLRPNSPEEELEQDPPATEPLPRRHPRTTVDMVSNPLLDNPEVHRSPRLVTTEVPLRRRPLTDSPVVDPALNLVVNLVVLPTLPFPALAVRPRTDSALLLVPLALPAVLVVPLVALFALLGVPPSLVVRPDSELMQCLF